MTNWIDVDSSNPLGKTIAVMGMCIGGIAYGIWWLVKWLFFAVIDSYETILASWGLVLAHRTLVEHVFVNRPWVSALVVFVVLVFVVSMKVYRETKNTRTKNA
jgi:hypothetical protein